MLAGWNPHSYANQQNFCARKCQYFFFFPGKSTFSPGYQRHHENTCLDIAPHLDFMRKDCNCNEVTHFGRLNHCYIVLYRMVLKLRNWVCKEAKWKQAALLQFMSSFIGNFKHLNTTSQTQWNWLCLCHMWDCTWTKFRAIQPVKQLFKVKKKKRLAPVSHTQWISICTIHMCTTMHIDVRSIRSS